MFGFVHFHRVLGCVLLIGCSGSADDGGAARPALRAGITAVGRAAAERHSPARAEPERDSPPPIAIDCDAEWKRVALLPAAPGAPKLGKQRAELLARAKGEPVVFVRAPEWTPSKSPVVRGYRRALANSRFPWETLRQIRDRFRFAPRIGRQVLLREGYLYADTADLGWALWDSVRLEHLFDEPDLWLERGRERLRLTRNTEGLYVHADGPDSGKPARLLLFDRVGVASEEPGPALHRDVRTLGHELGFDRMNVVRQTGGHLLAELRYGSVWSRAVIAADGPRLSRLCELPRDGDAAELARAESASRERARVVSALRTAMLAMVDEQLPFDEPKTEWGQQDGHLRSHWDKAYATSESSYFFQGDRYQVFTPTGQPLPPQVCIDFITQTFERASGAWWQPRGEPPGRTEGGLDFDALLSKSRRQVAAFINYAKEHPEHFELELLSSQRRLPYVFKSQFYRHLAREADRYAPGTIVIIRGYAPWDHYNVPHYHSFFVYEADPLTGMPLLLAGNAGKPRIQSWEPVMSTAPQRSINYRIRPRLDWLARAIPKSKPTDSAPPLMAMF